MSAHIEDLLSAYMDNELTAEERHQVEQHLPACRECSSVLQELLELQQQLFSMLQSVEAPETLEAAVLEDISFDALALPRSYVWLTIPLFSALLIMIIAFVLTGTYVMKIASIGFKIGFKLFYTLGGILGADPYVLLGLIGVSLLLMIGSGFSLKYLLKTKPIRGIQIEE